VTAHESSARAPAARGEGLAVDDADFDISDEADVRALFQAEERHFWHRARKGFIARKLEQAGVAPGARVLELGCGAGCVAAELARRGYDVTGVDGHRALIEVARRRAPRARFLCRDLRQSWGDLGREEFDVACLFDVIEHIDEPLALLERALARVRPGGLLVGTVPALMSLWSRIDEQSGHKTRYSAARLDALLRGVAAATVVEVAPFFRCLVPLLFVQRRVVTRHPARAASVANLRVPRWPVNHALYALCRVEERAAQVAGLGAVPGASLWFALARQR
jgi:SAM-dependent methyltransferase